MAVLTSVQLQELRRISEPNRAPIAHTKAQVNAALQAIEDWFEANRAALGAAIEAAAPGIFNITQKRALVKFWLLKKFERE